MAWTDEIGNLLKQYTTSGGAAAQPAPDVHAHFDQVTAAAPPNVVADGLTAAFNSNQTPPFSQMVSTLFSNSNGDQRAGMLNRLVGSINPSMLAQVFSAAGLSALATNPNPQLTPEQAQKVSPEAVQQLAAHAQNTDPTVVNSVSNFYAQHASLIKTLGGTALTIALAKVAERQKQA